MNNYNNEEEEEESEENQNITAQFNKKKNNIKNLDHVYFNNTINKKNSSNISNKNSYSKNNSKGEINFSFSPQKTKLSSDSIKTVSRNPNYNSNYNLNKKVFVPLNVMNLVSFINSQIRENNISLSALEALSTTKREDNLNGSKKFVLNKNQSIINFNNNKNDSEVILKKYKQNYQKLKNEDILSKTAFGEENLSPQKNNNYNNYYSEENNNNYNDYNNNDDNYNNNNLDYDNNKQKNVNSINNIDSKNNINGGNSKIKYIIFNNFMQRKENTLNMTKNSKNSNSNNQYN